MAGPGASEATYAASAATSSSLKTACLRGACWPGLGHRHAAGADLEVDGRGADADQRRAELVAVADGGDALAVLAVAERAAGEEELLALRDLLGLARLRVGLGGGEGRVEGAADQQSEQQHGETRKRSPTVPGEATSGSVEQTHDESLPVAVSGAYWMT